MPIAAGDQAHRLGVDRDRYAGREQIGGGQVFFVEMDRHNNSGLIGRNGLNRP